MAQALASFKSQYGDYPPSRIALRENGSFPVSEAGSPGSGALTDVTVGQLFQRSVTAFRKFWPRVPIDSIGTSPPTTVTNFYDFNGNGSLDSNVMVLQGSECLVFFLGGISAYDQFGKLTGVSGFAKNPANPFKNVLASNNRSAPLYEFDGGRLVTNPNSTMPAYLDTFNPQGSSFYAYFSTNLGAGYDPNDNNIAEKDGNEFGPISLLFSTTFPVYAAATSTGSPTPVYQTMSPAPNPYTSSVTVSSSGANVTYINSQSFQIISPGADGRYGVGGLYEASSTSGALVPEDQTSPLQAKVGASTVLSNSKDPGLRLPEKDNLTNFHNGRLE